MGHVLRQLNNYPIINKHQVTLPIDTEKFMACLEARVISVCVLLGDE